MWVQKLCIFTDTTIISAQNKTKWICKDLKLIIILKFKLEFTFDYASFTNCIENNIPYTLKVCRGMYVLLSLNERPLCLKAVNTHINDVPYTTLFSLTPLIMICTTRSWKDVLSHLWSLTALTTAPLPLYTTLHNPFSLPAALCGFHFESCKLVDTSNALCLPPPWTHILIHCSVPFSQPCLVHTSYKSCHKCS